MERWLFSSTINQLGLLFMVVTDSQRYQAYKPRSQGKIGTTAENYINPLDLLEQSKILGGLSKIQEQIPTSSIA
jgi:hypothetical protein